MITTLFGGEVPRPTPDPFGASLPRAKARAAETESPSVAEQQAILERFEAGKFLEAQALARAYAPLQAWTGTTARVLAGRLAGNLGGARLAHALHLRAVRLDPSSPIARYYAARALL